MTKNTSLAITFLKRVLLFLFLGQLVALAWMVYDRNDTDRRKVVDKVKTQSLLLASAAARSLTDYDFTYLGLLVDEVLKDRETIGIIVYDKNGTAILERAADRKGVAALTFTTPITQGTDVLGRIEVKYTIDHVRAEIFQQVLVLALLQSLIFLVVTLLIVYFFRRDLGRKLTKISSSIVAVSEGDLTRRIAYDGQDEFGSISHGFDFLVDNLAKTVGRISDVSHTLSGAISQVNKTVSDAVATADSQHTLTGQVRQTIHEATLSQEQIITNTGSLMELSQSNSAAHNEIKATFSGIAGNVDRLNMEIRALFSTIAELSRSTQNVAQLADKAASAVQDATQSVQEINASVGSIEKVVQESTDLAEKTTEIISDKGIVAVDNAMTSMAKIELFVTSLSASITRLDGRSKDIAKILSVIREVTDQAHLLSLNAQIIAGQAGEHGRSFAVVANEMKLLSSKTHSSTKEIEAIIQTIQTEIKSAVKETHETTEIVRHGSTVVAGAEEALQEILETSNRSTSMVKGIKESTSAQNRLVEHILTLIKELQVLNRDVKKATEDEERSTSMLVNGISGIRSSIDRTSKSTEEQATALQTISENIEIANQMTAEMAAASQQQLQTNTDIGRSMAGISSSGQEMILAVQEVADRITGIYEDIEKIRREMSVFNTDREKRQPETLSQAKVHAI